MSQSPISIFNIVTHLVDHEKPVNVGVQGFQQSCFSHYPSGRYVQHTAGQVYNALGDQLAAGLGSKSYSKWIFIRLRAYKSYDARNKCTLSKFLNDTKLGGAGASFRVERFQREIWIGQRAGQSLTALYLPKSK